MDDDDDEDEDDDDDEEAADQGEIDEVQQQLDEARHRDFDRREREREDIDAEQLAQELKERFLLLI